MSAFIQFFNNQVNKSKQDDSSVAPSHSLLQNTEFLEKPVARKFRVIKFQFSGLKKVDTAVFNQKDDSGFKEEINADSSPYDRLLSIVQSKQFLVQKGYHNETTLKRLKDRAEKEQLFDNPWIEQIKDKAKVQELRAENNRLLERIQSKLTGGDGECRVETIERENQTKLKVRVVEMAQHFRQVQTGPTAWFRWKEGEAQSNHLVNSQVDKACALRWQTKAMKKEDYEIEPCAFRHNKSYYLVCRDCLCPIPLRTRGVELGTEPFPPHQCMSKHGKDKWVSQAETCFLMQHHLDFYQYDYSAQPWKFFLHNPRQFFAGHEPMLRTRSSGWAGPYLSTAFSKIVIPDNREPMRVDRNLKQIFSTEDPQKYTDCDKGNFYVFQCREFMDQCMFPDLQKKDGNGVIYFEGVGSIAPNTEKVPEVVLGDISKQNQKVLGKRSRTPVRKTKKLTVEKSAKAKAKASRKSATITEKAESEKSGFTSPIVKKEIDDLSADNRTPKVLKTDQENEEEIEEINKELEQNRNVSNPVVPTNTTPPSSDEESEEEDIAEQPMGQSDDEGEIVDSEDEDQIKDKPEEVILERADKPVSPVKAKEEERQLLQQPPDSQKQGLQSDEETIAHLMKVNQQLLEEKIDLKKQLREAGEKHLDFLSQLREEEDRQMVVYKDWPHTLKKISDQEKEITKLKKRLAQRGEEEERLQTSLNMSQAKIASLEEDIKKYEEKMSAKYGQLLLFNKTVDEETTEDLRKVKQHFTDFVNQILTNVAIGLGEDSFNVLAPKDVLNTAEDIVWKARYDLSLTEEVAQNFTEQRKRAQKVSDEFRRRNLQAQLDEDKAKEDEKRTVSVVGSNVEMKKTE